MFSCLIQFSAVVIFLNCQLTEGIRRGTLNWWDSARRLMRRSFVEVANLESTSPRADSSVTRMESLVLFLLSEVYIYHCSRYRNPFWCEFSYDCFSFWLIFVVSALPARKWEHPYGRFVYWCVRLQTGSWVFWMFLGHLLISLLLDVFGTSSDQFAYDRLTIRHCGCNRCVR